MFFNRRFNRLSGLVEPEISSQEYALIIGFVDRARSRQLLDANTIQRPSVRYSDGLEFRSCLRKRDVDAAFPASTPARKNCIAAVVLPDPGNPCNM